MLRCFHDTIDRTKLDRQAFTSKHKLLGHPAWDERVTSAQERVGKSALRDSLKNTAFRISRKARHLAKASD